MPVRGCGQKDPVTPAGGFGNAVKHRIAAEGKGIRFVKNQQIKSP